jgi:hypothetical protein
MGLTSLLNCVCLLERKPPVVGVDRVAGNAGHEKVHFHNAFTIDLMGSALESSDSPATAGRPRPIGDGVLGNAQSPW